MIDIHNHLMPYIDDGSPSLDHSLDMAEIAAASGVDTVILTPHCNVPGYFDNYNTPELQSAFRSLQSSIRRAHIPLQVLPGMEVFTADNISSLIHHQQLIGLNFSDYLLIEFDFASHPHWISSRLQEIRQHGKIPVIAHPERYDCIQDAPCIAEVWLKSGCLLQCNKDSFLGGFGSHAEVAAHFMLEHRMISFIASDAHRAAVRTPQMHEIYQYIACAFSESDARRLMQDNPMHVCRNLPLPAPDFIPYARTSYWKM